MRNERQKKNVSTVATKGKRNEEREIEKEARAKWETNDSTNHSVHRMRDVPASSYAAFNDAMAERILKKNKLWFKSLMNHIMFDALGFLVFFPSFLTLRLTRRFQVAHNVFAAEMKSCAMHATQFPSTRNIENVMFGC